MLDSLSAVVMAAASAHQVAEMAYGNITENVSEETHDVIMGLYDSLEAYAILLGEHVNSPDTPEEEQMRILNLWPYVGTNMPFKE